MTTRNGMSEKDVMKHRFTHVMIFDTSGDKTVLQRTLSSYSGK